MKKGKLITSLCMLILSLACLTFGVYSAVKTTFTASGTITFNAYNLDVDAKVTITGTKETYEPKYLTSNSERTDHIWTEATYSPMTSFSLSNLTFDELGEQQNLINIHFEFVNYSNYQVEVIAETTTSGSAWDSDENVSKLLYQPTMQTLMDSVENTSQNTSGFSIMFTAKGKQITGTAENMSIAVTLKPAEQEYVIENAALENYYSGDVYDRLNYNNLAYAVKSDTTVGVGFDNNSGDTTLETYPIPTKILGRTVDEVYEYAFDPQNWAFGTEECMNYMFIPESVETIGYYAFANTYNLTNVILSNGLISIGESAFYESALESIVIPSSVKIIDSSFDGCYNFSSTIVGNEEYLLNEKGEPMVLMNVVDSSVTNLDIPQTVHIIYDWALQGCSKLTSVTIPDSVTQIGYRAFGNCYDLVSLTIPSSVTSIGNYTFEDCRSLTSITIPSSVASIGDHAFSGCHSLASITIPSSVTSIGSSAFTSCYALAEVYNLSSSITLTKGSKDNGYLAYYVQDSDAIYTSTSTPSRISEENGVKYYTNGSKVVALAANKAIESTSIKQGCTAISQCAFSYCSSLTSITIPDSVIIIDGYAFQNCRSLTSITIPSSVTSIGSSAFSGCCALAEVYNLSSSINLTKGSEDNGKLAYNLQDEDAIYTSLGIPSRVSEENGVMYYTNGSKVVALCPADRSATSVSIKQGCITINQFAFISCDKLITITIPSSVTIIGYDAFSGCSSLASITIPSSVTSIGDSAFSGCSSLASIIIPSSVTIIGYNAFSGCSSLASITIPSSVTSIGAYAFSGCSSLTTITIPSSVTSIGSGAFQYCSNLTTITIPESVTRIGSYAFSMCSNLATITCNSASVGTEDIGCSWYFTPTGETKGTGIVSKWQKGTGVYTVYTY